MKNEIHGLSQDLPPTILTIFGATGGLFLDYLFPTLVHMQKEGLLPAHFRLVCVGRREFDKKQFLEFLKKGSHSVKNDEAFKNLSKRIVYYKGNFNDPGSFKNLSGILADKKLGRNKHLCFNRLYYFSTAPVYFKPIARILQQNNLLMGCTEHHRTIRVLIEKPFGDNLASAKSLNKLLLQFFTEEQIYRIDHYLGKETVQNLFVARFANDFLEPIWNNKYIDHVEISALEPIGAGQRAQFYDQTGALKDFVQNHILNILALLAMDKPKNLNAAEIGKQKLKVLTSLDMFNKTKAKTSLVKAQYAAGKNMKSYAADVGHNSKTETFVALKVFLSSPRWKNVPFYLRTGKRLIPNYKLTEISVHFKKSLNGLFENNNPYKNVLTFQIQPDEHVRLQINNKIPGFGIRLHPANLEFGYKEAFKQEIPAAHERLLLDFMQGDQRLFIRSAEIEAAWKFIDSVIRSWQRTSLYKYPAGGRGPKEAEKLINADGREWWTR